MSDKKISQLTAATTPLAGTEVLPIVQSGSTVKVPNNDLRPKQIQSNATSGVLQVVGPAVASTRVMTTPDANFTVARTDAGQTFTNTQIFDTRVVSGHNAAVGSSKLQAHGLNGTQCADSIFSVQKAGEGYGVFFSVNSAGNTLVQAGAFNDGAYYDLYLQNNGGNTYIGQGNLTVNTGNLVIGTSGKGIDFSATPGTGTSELLADYEEGTWTPTFENLTIIGTPTYTGTYTKIGRQVSFTLRVQSTTSTQAGAASTYFTLPFNPLTSSTLQAVNGGASASYGNGLIFSGDNSAYTPAWPPVADVVISGTYFV